MVLAMAHNGLPFDAPPLPQNVPRILPQPFRHDYMENGRLYHEWKKPKYPFPCDEEEKDRMDIYHKLFSVARREALHSPLYTLHSHQHYSILDLGCGTGIWTIDMADKYPNSRVDGVDLSYIQPPTMPPNCRFSLHDIEDDWSNMERNFWDLIHLRMLNGAIRSWPDVYRKIFEHLKPGSGWLEHVEIDIIPRCDDGTLPPDSHLVHWSKLVLEATARAGRPLAYNIHTREMLEAQGFTEIQEQTIRIPFNGWPTDPQLKEIGRWYHLGLTQGLEALTLAPLTRHMDWKKSDVDNLVAQCKREICLKKIHAYCNMHIWIARRPAER